MKTKAEQQVISSMGQNIKSFRIANGIPVNDMAAILGKTRTWLSNVEAGKADLTITMLIKVCKVFNINLHQIVEHDLVPDVDKFVNRLHEANLKIIELQQKLLNKERNDKLK